MVSANTITPFTYADTETGDVFDIENPVIEKPVIEQSATEEPIVEQPAIEEPVIIKEEKNDLI